MFFARLRIKQTTLRTLLAPSYFYFPTGKFIKQFSFHSDIWKRFLFKKKKSSLIKFKSFYNDLVVETFFFQKKRKYSFCFFLSVRKKNSILSVIMKWMEYIITQSNCFLRWWSNIINFQRIWISLHILVFKLNSKYMINLG